MKSLGVYVVDVTNNQDDDDYSYKTIDQILIIHLPYLHLRCSDTNLKGSQSP